MKIDNEVLNDSTHEYDVIKQQSKKYVQDKKVGFSLQTSNEEAPLSSTEMSKKASTKNNLVSPTGVSEFDDSLYDVDPLEDDRDDQISPIARMRKDKEQNNNVKNDTLADVVASYLNLNNFIDVYGYEGDERTACSEEEDDEFSTYETETHFLDLAEEYMEKASDIALALCR